MFKILTFTNKRNYAMAVVKVIGERKTFEPIKLEYLVVDEGGAEYYVDSTRVFDTVEEVNVALKEKAETNYDEAIKLINQESKIIEEKLLTLV